MALCSPTCVPTGRSRQDVCRISSAMCLSEVFTIRVVAISHQEGGHLRVDRVCHTTHLRIANEAILTQPPLQLLKLGCAGSHLKYSVNASTLAHQWLVDFVLLGLAFRERTDSDFARASFRSEKTVTHHIFRS
eukprot:791142-Amphidinium_carterae.1